MPCNMKKWYDISDNRMEFGSLYYMNIKMLYLGTYTRIIYMKFINGKIMRISKLSDERNI